VIGQPKLAENWWCFAGKNHLVQCSEAESDRMVVRAGLDPGTRRLQGQRTRPLGHGFYDVTQGAGTAPFYTQRAPLSIS
jgi:hypothetical protein